MESCSIYMISSNESNKIYIGVTKKKLNQRLRDHILESQRKLKQGKKTTYKNNWINSKLSNNLKIEISEIDVVPLSEFSFWERHYISLFRSWDFSLMNLTDGGEGIFGYKFSNESKEKISKIKSFKVYEVNENCEVIKEFASTKEVADFYGINKNTVQKNLCGRNKSCSSRVFTYDPLSLNQKEIKHIFATMKSRHKRPVVQYDLLWNKISEYDSIFQASNICGIKNDSHLGDACLDKNKTCNGYRWSFK